MKDFLRQLVGDASIARQGRNVVREYLQARLLQALQHSGAMIPLAFHGGTALRFLYAIPRYSEDLDFALEQHTELYDFRKYLRAVQGELQAEGYQIDIRVNDSRIVHSALIRFPGLLYELGLSPHSTEVLAVKIEVDTNPPSGAGLTTTVVRRHILLNLSHHNRSSLLAGKLHAVLQRSYAKGRDIYDLLWYLSDPNWPEPNLALLNNALAQSDWSGAEVTEANWRQIVWERLVGLDWSSIVQDVRPFLEREAEIELLTPVTFSQLLGIRGL